LALVKNELHDFATHNYVWTLSALYPGEINDPRLYKGKTGKLPIASSGGLGNRKTITTAAEDARGVNVEFYIEDVNITTSIGPSPTHPVNDTAVFEFTVQEPYSMGLFMQSIAVAASKAGFGQYYTRAPFLLSVSFKGQLQDGTYHTTSINNWVIEIGAISMRLNSSGSYYTCTATSWSHALFRDSVETVKQEVRIEGATVGEMLSFGPRSLATLLNSDETREAARGNRLVPNVYQIDFPFQIGENVDSQGEFSGALGKIQGALSKVNEVTSSFNTASTALGNFGKALSNIGNPSITTIDKNGIKGRGFNASEGPESTRPLAVNNTITQFSETINSFAQSISVSGINQIGNEISQSLIAESFVEFGDIAFGDEDIIWDKEKKILTRGNMTMQVDNANSRVFVFSAGTKITEIIETVIYMSKWGQNFIQQKATNEGFYRGFKIHPRNFILSTQELKRTGKLASRNVYEVHTYFVHSSTFSMPTSTNNYEANVADCVKAYNYMYTGLNRDVLDFELNLETAYTMMVPADYGQRGLHDLSVYGGAVSAPRSVTGLGNSLTDFENSLNSVKGTLTELIDIYRIAGGTFNENSKTRTAFAFRQALLSNASSLETVSLSIIGDPYYFNESDAGNYVAKAFNPNINSDLKADFTRGELYVLFRFNSPVDYKNSDNLLLPDPADAITGIYRVNVVDSVFSNGKFTQNLTMQRAPRQDLSTVSSIKRIVDNFFNVLGAVGVFSQAVGANQVSKNIENFMSEVGPVANSILGIVAIGENISTLIDQNPEEILEGLKNLQSVFGQVGALGQQIGQLRERVAQIDNNTSTPTNSIRPIQSSIRTPSSRSSSRFGPQ